MNKRNVLGNRKIYGLLLILLLFLLTSCGGSKSKNKEMQRTEPPNSNIESVTEVEVTNKKVVLESTSKMQSPTTSPESTDMILDNNNQDKSKFVIVIDPGHQADQNSEQEPIGPGAKKTKPKVSSGTQGKYTGKPEYEVNLEVSLKLRDMLEEKGYQVIMVRESHDVNISNSQRAAIANENKADVFVRIHCNGSDNTKDNGILTMCPTKDNPYCSQIYEKSRQLSDCILNRLCDITGAKNDGVIETDSMSGINWCKVPVTIVEMGFMTNKEEDTKLSSTDYQNKLAIGIAEGIEEFLIP